MAGLAFDVGSSEGTSDPSQARRVVCRAESVSDDDHARLVDDPDYSESEDRFVLWGSAKPVRGSSSCTRPRARGADPNHLSPQGDAQSSVRATIEVHDHEEIVRLYQIATNSCTRFVSSGPSRSSRRATHRYFKALADENGIGYQTLITSFLRDRASSKRRPTVRWARSKGLPKIGLEPTAARRVHRAAAAEPQR